MSLRTWFLYGTISSGIFVLFVYISMPNLTFSPPQERRKTETEWKCDNKKLIPRLQQRGDYWVLYNYFIAKASFNCDESVTYTTHGDFTFLDNLVTLVEKWEGPISIALYSPGTDFDVTIETIRYLRDCEPIFILEYVTFHIFFPTSHMPKKVNPSSDVFKKYNCNQTPSNATEKTYRNKNNLTYPVNVARNIARESAQTHFILASDIELYPSQNLIPSFLEMIARNPYPISTKKRQVFVFNLFEVVAEVKVPEDKNQLIDLFERDLAVPFHEHICAPCHRVPNRDTWLNTKQSQRMDIFTIGKRLWQFASWEPIFIGTNNDPFYDERLTWEGQSDKMGQAYQMCILDYEFLVLNNAFLVHKPGIKKYVNDPTKNSYLQKTNNIMRNQIFPELNVFYENRFGCWIPLTFVT